MVIITSLVFNIEGASLDVGVGTGVVVDTFFRFVDYDYDNEYDNVSDPLEWTFESTTLHSRPTTSIHSRLRSGAWNSEYLQADI